MSSEALVRYFRSVYLKRLTKWLLEAVVVAVGIADGYAWYRLRPLGIPAECVASNGRIETTEIDIATKYEGHIEQVLVCEGARNVCVVGKLCGPQ